MIINMSEPKETSRPTILDIVRVDQATNDVSFSISKHTSGADVLATLSYLTPDDEVRVSNIKQIIDYRMRHNSLLHNDYIYLENIGESNSSQARLVTSIALGNSPRVDDIVSVLSQIYTTDVVNEKMILLFETLVDKRLMDEVTITMTSNNEFSSTTEFQICTEMEEMTNKYLRDEDF